MNKLLIFAKSPIKGKVKTRLKKDTTLTDDDILKLYEAFLKDTIVAASLSKAQRIYIAYYPEDSREVMLSVKSKIRRPIHQMGAPKSEIKMFPQSGKDFDGRLTNALKNISPTFTAPSKGGRGKREGDNVVILGSDSPHIQPATINKAFSFLSNQKSDDPSIKWVPRNPKFKSEIVLGPSGEGGVYLIGLKYPSPNSFPTGGGGKREGEYLNFKGIFTSGNESDNLLKIARKKKLRLLVLEEVTDVDVKSDLVTLISNLSMMQYSSRNTTIHLPKYTINIIKKLGLTVDRKGRGTREKYLFRTTS